ncbi:lamin tail domain-containing protein [Candidatus Daviesbacteria bacterium]|nr:lamin tail domain-containing protein [Candidatus Daviesbacteria bacterium]
MKSLKFLLQNLFLFLTFFLISFFLYPKTIFADDNIVINEFLPTPSDGNDWIELYNKSDNLISLSGWSLEDTTSKMKDVNCDIPSKGQVFVDVSNRLNKDGDTITLKDNSGTVVDTKQYTDPGVNVSWVRVPDGGDWTTSNSPTKPTTECLPSSPTPSSTATPTPEPTSDNSNSPFFTISSNTTSVTSNNDFSVTVEFLIPSSPNKDFYVEGAFFKSGTTNYCGFTKVSNNWISYSDDFNHQLLAQTNDEGRWGAYNINVKFDPNDNGCKDSGDYRFKVRRFNSTGSDYIWSNDIPIAITVVSSATSTPTPTPTTALAANITPTPISKSTSSSSPNPFAFINSTSSANILGTSSASQKSSDQVTDKTLVSDSKQSSGNKWIYFGVGFLVLSIGGGFILKLKRQKNEIPHKLNF